MELRGTVRFRFRSPEHDIDVLLEGEAKWVESLREEIGLTGEVGVVQPLAARMVDPDEPEPESATGGEEDFFEELPLPEETVLPGPPPDPSRIPSVPRVIGSLAVDCPRDNGGVIGDYANWSALDTDKRGNHCGSEVRA